MPTMSSYCKAYPAPRLREFPHWQEKVAPLSVTAAGATPAGDPVAESADSATEEYYYLHDNYTVTAGVFVDQDVAFDAITDDWKRFCADRLEFEVPAEVRELDREGPPAS